MKAADPGHLGSVLLGDGRCRFCVWAPFAERVDVRIFSDPERLIPLTRTESGYHSGIVERVHPGDRYVFRLNGNLERPDPASRLQPQGVHGPSQVVDPEFGWTDDRWRGIPLERYLLYELHVGAFTTAGTFDAVIGRLDDLVALGITALELMPVAQFPGDRNWGYDGVYPFAVQHSYGGPQGLKRLMDACHARNLAVVLDVVYNHLGPEGNYFSAFGPYFSEMYATPWGAPINFDGPHSDEVRRYFIENALYWIEDCHMDALRLDAVHAILDFSAHPFLEELARTVHKRAADRGRQVYLIAESALNDTRVIRSEDHGGWGMDAQWSDDLHHALHAVITGERQGYYCDFGEFDQLLKALREGFVYDGQYSPYRKRRHGNSSRHTPSHRLVVFSQNHDQVGNRLQGERLSALVSFEALKAAAGIILLSANLPLLFMGEEYGETAPFPFFISHSDPGLIEAVRKGRREEFASFQWQAEPPDPQAEGTFTSAKLNPALYHTPGPHQALWDFHRRLIELRTRISALAELSKDQLEVFGSRELCLGWLHRWSSTDGAVVMFHPADTTVSAKVDLPAGTWLKKLDSSSQQWDGPGTVVPEQIDTSGEVELEFLPYSFLVWFRSRKS
jgi:maltooligosyltrehalose trehalohydrolase